MIINFYIKDNECVGYSTDNLEKAIEHDTITVLEGEDINMNFPWKYENGELIQCTLDDMTLIMQQENEIV
jgi:hypothetical protein